MIALVPSISIADDFLGGIPMTTVQSGVVSGGLFVDASPAPDWGTYDVTRSFTLPDHTDIQWARLYIGVYCGHQQNNYLLSVTTSFDGNGDDIYDDTWSVPYSQDRRFTFLANLTYTGNDNTAYGGGSHDPYVYINPDCNRVTSDYFMAYDVTSLIHSNNLSARVATSGFDGRIKVITLVVAYNDNSGRTIHYWVNEGHDTASYNEEDTLGIVYVGETSFATSGLAAIRNATLIVDYMASKNGYYSFPTADYDQPVRFEGSSSEVQGTYSDPLPYGYDVQGPYSGVQSWNVTGLIVPGSNSVLGFHRDLNDAHNDSDPNGAFAGYFKIPLAFLTVQTASPPVAGFTVNATSGMAPLTVRFTDNSSGEITSQAWDFDNDGATDSTEKDPGFTFNMPGNYTVKLHVVGPGGASDKTLAIHVLVPPAPVAGFTANMTSGIVPFAVGFTDLSTNRPVSWTWDFGDGNVSHEANTTHLYTIPGKYSVSLTVTNTGGSDIASVGEYIYAKPQAPVARFNANATIGIVPLAVRFADDSTNQPVSWLWDFGDGNTSAEESPSHVYASAGMYTVSLTAENAGGSNTTVAKDYIIVTDRPVFYLSPSSGAGAVGDEQTFDIIAEALPNGLREYSLNVSSADPGIADIADIEYPGWAVVKAAPGSGSLAAAGAEDSGDSVRAGTSGVILATITIKCNVPGTTAITLGDASLTDDLGGSCAPVVVGSDAHVYVPLNASIVASANNGTAPFAVSFTGHAAGNPGPSSWHWDFGDGNTASGRNATHTYTVPGNYSVRLTAANEYDSHDATLSINVSAPLPVANFSYDVTTGPAPLSVQFTDNSGGGPISWKWDFGDGNTSSLRNPLHIYTLPNGLSPPYTVSLTVANDVGNDTKTLDSLIKVNYPLPVADFTASPTSGDLPLAVQFTDNSQYATAWSWDFGDGNTSSLQNPSHTYSTAGNYTVELSVSSAGGSDYKQYKSYIHAGSVPQYDLYISGTVNTIGQVVFAREPNTVYVYYITNKGPQQSPETEVEVHSSDGFVGRSTVPALASEGQITVGVNDTTIRSSAGANITYTATLDPDSEVVEANESNNVKSSSAKSVVYNGYKGKRYLDGGSDDTTVKTYDLRGGIVYSFGDSVYVSGSFGSTGWNSYSVNWTAADLKVQDNATIEEVRLYVPYTWDNTNVAPDGVHITFNGQVVPYEHWYHDVSNFGAYYNYVYGLLTYDVTDLYKKNANNKALFTRDGNPNAKLSMAGFTLAVIYKDQNATRKQIFLNEEFDLLGADPSGYGTNSTEATAYIPFSGMAIDTANVTHANLVTFVPWGSGPEGNLIFNGQVIGTNVWDYGSSYSPQVAVDSRDVKSYLQSSGNIACIQSTEGSTPCMAAEQEFLVVEYNTPGAISDEELNNTTVAAQVTSGGKSSSTSRSTSGGDHDTGPDTAASTDTAAGTAPSYTAILALFLVIALTGLTGMALYYLFEGKKIPLKVGIPAVMVTVILVAAAGGFVAGQSAQSTGTIQNPGAANMTSAVPDAVFSVMSTIQDIKDTNVSNVLPDYPSGFTADNGILFILEKGDPVELSGLRISLHTDNADIAFSPSDTIPAGSCTSSKVTRYLQEIGGNDGTIKKGGWLMLYADGCLESTGSQGDSGKALSWRPSGSAAPFVLYKGEKCSFTITNAAGNLIQEGNFTLTS